jgi:hypothetical protein
MESGKVHLCNTTHDPHSSGTRPAIALYSWTMRSTRARREGRANPCRAKNQSCTRAQRCRRAPSPSPNTRRRCHASRPLPGPHANGRTRATWPNDAASGCKNSSSTTPHRQRAHKWRGGVRERDEATAALLSAPIRGGVQKPPSSVRPLSTARGGDQKALPCHSTRKGMLQPRYPYQRCQWR